MDTQSAPSITELAQQHGVPRESLAALVRARIQQVREATGEPPVDRAALDRVLDADSEHETAGDAAPDGDETPVAAYTSSATVAPARAPSAGSISVYA
jgi:hypothetical protein